MRPGSILTHAFLLAGILLAGFFGPWWAPAGFIVVYSAMWPVKKGHAALAGGICLGLSYLVLALMSSGADQAGIIEKTGQMMGGLQPGALIAFTTFIGWITGALSGWLGRALGDLFKGQ